MSKKKHFLQQKNSQRAFKTLNLEAEETQELR